MPIPVGSPLIIADSQNPGDRLVAHYDPTDILDSRRAKWDHEEIQGLEEVSQFRALQTRRLMFTLFFASRGAHSNKTFPASGRATVQSSLDWLRKKLDPSGSVAPTSPVVGFSPTTLVIFGYTSPIDDLYLIRTDYKVTEWLPGGGSNTPTRAKARVEFLQVTNEL